MNELIQTAEEKVTNVATIMERLSLTENSDTERCADEEGNTEFTTAVNDAISAVQAAMDVVDGPALTAFDTAQDELRIARQEFFRPVIANRRHALDRVTQAVSAFEQGLRHIED